jgi:hypothetical protein
MEVRGFSKAFLHICQTTRCHIPKCHESEVRRKVNEFLVAASTATEALWVIRDVRYLEVPVQRLATSQRISVFSFLTG